MGTVGFLDLPAWQDLLRKSLTRQNLQELLHAPVLGTEEIDPPWTTFEPEEFFSIVETAFHFADRRPPRQMPIQLVTSDPIIGYQRFSEGKQTQTGVRGAIGGTYPILDVFNIHAGYPPPRRLLAMTDGVAGAILSEMEHSGNRLEEALQEIQWRSLAPGNATRHLHGLIARDRLALLGAMIFGVVLNPEEIPVEGFGQVEPRDMELASRFQFTIRLMGVVEKLDRGLAAWVRPVLIPSRYLMAQVRGGAEAAYLQMEDNDSFFFSGTGTTPEVILRGMIRDWKSLGAHGSLPFPEQQATVRIAPEKMASRCYIRLALLDFDTTIAQLMNLLSAKGVGIKGFFQPDMTLETSGKNSEPEMVIFTRPISEGLLQETLREIRETVKLASLKACYRYEGDIVQAG